jgi:hypothetical protein
MRIVLLLAIAVLASGCRDEQPPAPTSEQAEQLNEAEAMLNAMAPNEEGPEQSPGPSNASD